MSHSQDYMAQILCETVNGDVVMQTEVVEGVPGMVILGLEGPRQLEAVSEEVLEEVTVEKPEEGNGQDPEGTLQ